jgi:hypothetical protein
MGVQMPGTGAKIDFAKLLGFRHLAALAADYDEKRLSSDLDRQGEEPLVLRRVAGALFAKGGEISDVRLKRDIVEVGRLDNGIGLYRYRYLWSDEVYVGVMAQEVARIMPDAVTRGSDGYLRVNYERLGLRLITWTEWTGQSQRVGAAA